MMNSCVEWYKSCMDSLFGEDDDIFYVIGRMQEPGRCVYG